MLPSQPGEPGEVAVSGDVGAVVLQRQRGEIGILHQVAAAVRSLAQLPEQRPVLGVCPQGAGGRAAKTGIHEPLDGLAWVAWNGAGDNAFVVSTWDGGRIFEVDIIKGVVKTETILEGYHGPADFTYDQVSGDLVVPVFMDDAVAIRNLEKAPGHLPVDKEGE